MSAALKAVKVPGPLLEKGGLGFDEIEIFEDRVVALSQGTPRDCWRFDECRDVCVMRADTGAGVARVVFVGYERSLELPATSEGALADNFAMLVGGLARQAFLLHRGLSLDTKKTASEPSAEREEQGVVRTLLSQVGERLRTTLEKKGKVPQKPVTRKKLLFKGAVALCFGALALLLVFLGAASEQRFLMVSPFLLVFGVLAINNAAFVLRGRKQVKGIVRYLALPFAILGLAAGACSLLAFLAYPAIMTYRYMMTKKP